MEELMEKLSLVDMFPSVVLAIKKDEKTNKAVMFSIQREASGRALRYLKVNDSFFDEIEVPNAPQEAIEIDAERVLKAVKKIMPGTQLTIEKDDKLVISGHYQDKDDDGKVTNTRTISHHLTYTEPDEVETGLPLLFKDGIPHVGKKEVPLDIDVKVNLEDLKSIVELTSVYNTDFYKFDLEKGKPLTVRVGDLRSFSDYCTYQPRFHLKAGEEFSLILTYGIKQVVSILRYDDITMRASSNVPCWVYEKSDDYTLGILFPPHIPSEEEMVE